jgi:hypothetical protein
MTFLRLPALYRRHFRDHRRERMFLASLSFFVTFGVTRIITNSQRGRVDPFQISLGSVHIHHLVWGILVLLAVGYMWLVQIGTGSDGQTVRFGRATALLYGAGAALTLDEFALWLNLQDVYWQREGRLSVDAALLFGGLVSVGLWGRPFLRAVTHRLARLIGRPPLHRREPRRAPGQAAVAPLQGGEAAPPARSSRRV